MYDKTEIEEVHVRVMDKKLRACTDNTVDMETALQRQVAGMGIRF